MAGNISMHSVQDMLSLSWETFRTEFHQRGPTIDFIQQFTTDITNRSQFSMENLYVIIVATILFTMHRYFITSFILKPLGKSFSFSSKDQRKFPESGCKLLYYSLFFMYEYYLVNYRYPEFMTDVGTQWNGWYQEMPVPDDILYLYLFEAGFYFHSIYATIFMDVWKKDSIAMLIHHALANSLILFSLTTRYHCIGLIVLYLHDIADVLLEGTKIITFFKNKTSSAVLEGLSAVGFLSFTASWFWCRLCVYPQTVLYSGLHVGLTVIPDGPFYFFFNSMLFMLFMLNIWWFHFIVALIVRIATGQSQGVEDTREYEEQLEKEKAKTNFHVNKTTEMPNGKQIKLQNGEFQRKQPSVRLRNI